MRFVTRFTLLISISILYLSFSATAQEEQHHNEGESEHESEGGRHVVLVGFGWTYIPGGGDLEDNEADGFFVPTIGLDYMYKISPRWEIGLMTDLELDHYLIVDKNLERENAFIATAIGLYHLTHRLSIFAGGGIEIESHENLAIFRAGLDSPFHLKKGWLLLPSFTYDFKEDYNTWALKLYLGKEF